MSLRLALVPLVLILTAATCPAQFIQPNHDAWLMRNYHFAPPPPPGQIQPVLPVVGQLKEVQMTNLNILRKANLYDDFEAALAASAQATQTAQLLGLITGQLTLQAAPQPQSQTKPSSMEQRGSPAQIYLVAVQDGTIQPASAVWADTLMLHYTTLQGGHEQIRLDRVDWKLSAELNRRLEAPTEDRPLTPLRP